MKQRVITVHGINSEGRWQSEIRKAIEPHFQCEELRYGDYRNLGLLSLMLEPRSLLVLLFATYILAFLGMLESILLILIPGAFLLVSYGLAAWRRRQALDRFRNDLVKIGNLGPLRPHLIAHCFGTYLAGWTLMRSPLQLDGVILAGAVLPARYNWRKLFEVNPGAFSRLRNEVGRRDWIAWLVLLLFPFCSGLGSSGVLGFFSRMGKGRQGVTVHTVRSAYGPCPVCQSPAGPSPVHNVRIQEVTSRDRFIGIDHVEAFWLPFLWGIEPREYQDFLRICSTALELERENRVDPRLRMLEKELGERHWSFLGRSLNEEIRQGAGELGARDVAYALSLIWNAVGEALEERRNENPREQIVLALKPQHAIVKTVSVLRSQ